MTSAQRRCMLSCNLHPAPRQLPLPCDRQQCIGAPLHDHRLTPSCWFIGCSRSHVAGGKQRQALLLCTLRLLPCRKPRWATKVARELRCFVGHTFLADNDTPVPRTRRPLKSQSLSKNISLLAISQATRVNLTHMTRARRAYELHACLHLACRRPSAAHTEMPRRDQIAGPKARLPSHGCTLSDAPFATPRPRRSPATQTTLLLITIRIPTAEHRTFLKRCSMAKVVQ